MKAMALALGRSVKCRQCDAKHVERHRKPGTCLTCDILGRLDSGQSVGGLRGSYAPPRVPDRRGAGWTKMKR